MTDLVLIRGLPGSGKSTLAKKRFPEHVLYEADMYFLDNDRKYVFDKSKLPLAHKWCLKMARSALQIGCNVVVANTFSRVQEMLPYTDMAANLKVKVKILECTGQHHSIHGVPDAVIECMADRWELIDWPDYEFADTR